MRDSVFFLNCIGRQTMLNRKRSAQKRFRRSTAPRQTPRPDVKHVAMDRPAQLVTKQRSPGHTKLLLCLRATDSLSRLTLRLAEQRN